MHFLLKVILLLTLAILVRDDLRMRSVHIGHLLLVAACLFIPAYEGLGFSELLYQAGFNMAFVGCQLAIILLLGLLLRGISGLQLLKMIGAGDLVFFAILAIGLAPARFILFYVSGLTLALIGFMALRYTKNTRYNTVPTAGFLAAYLAIWQIVEMSGYMGPLYMEPIG